MSFGGRLRGGRLGQRWHPAGWFSATHLTGRIFLVAVERTFAIIKPDAVSRGLQGEILSRITKAGFQIVAIKSMRLTKGEAGGFYAVHRERPFFGELTDFMSSGKIFAMVIEAEGAILKWRDTMGANRSQESRSRHHPPRPRHQHRQQRHAWLRRT
jgi:nucleoside-diphosphate kinase